MRQTSQTLNVEKKRSGSMGSRGESATDKSQGILFQGDEEA